MDNFIDKIEIRNFKSIKEGVLNECKRINLIIGRPNVGKSNILEALSIFSLPFLKNNTSKKVTGFLRMENEVELFFNGDVREPATVKTNRGEYSLSYDKFEGLFLTIIANQSIFNYSIDSNFNIKGPSFLPEKLFIRKYSFQTNVTFKKSSDKYLLPPFGSNLLNVIENDPQLKEEIASLFREYGLQLVFDKGSQSLKILQTQRDGDIFLIPYNSIADTLQRIIFFKSAIASNRNAVLLFEEPEAHSFPPYISHITQEMIYRKDNQYFIATHSPFILNDLLENSRDELCVYNIDYKDHKTIINRLTANELHEIYQNGVDLFTNNESYL